MRIIKKYKGEVIIFSLAIVSMAIQIAILFGGK